MFFYEYHYGFAPTYEQCKLYYAKYKPAHDPSRVGDITNFDNFLLHQRKFVQFIVDDIRTKLPKEWGPGASHIYITAAIGNRSDELAPWWPIIVFAHLKPKQSERDTVKERLARLKGLVWPEVVKLVQDLLENEEEPSWHTDAIEAPIYGKMVGKVRKELSNVK